MNDLTELIIRAPILGQACVIDRRGYDARYRQMHAGNRWMLCKTAFTVLVERAAKFAQKKGRRLRVYPEKGDETANSYLESYYAEMLGSGMPFGSETSAKYDPLKSDDLRKILYGLRFKMKSSPMAQYADLCLYPMSSWAL